MPAYDEGHTELARVLADIQARAAVLSSDEALALAEMLEAGAVVMGTASVLTQPVDVKVGGVEVRLHPKSWLEKLGKLGKPLKLRRKV